MRVLITGAGGFLGRRLTQALLARDTLVGPGGRSQKIAQIILSDVAPIPAPDHPDIEVTVHTGDLSDPVARDQLCALPYDSLFHLASQLTYHAEADPDRAWAVNVDPLRALIGAAQDCPRVVFASSIAVFGGAFPTEVADDLAPLPQTTYGTHKAINELILADASRHGRVDGRALRLPIVLARPGAVQPVVSDQVAAIIREPLEGRDFQAPFPTDAELPVVSAGAVVRALMTLHDLPPDRLPPKRALNLPALTVSVAQMVSAATRAGATGRVTCVPDPASVAVVEGWPRHFTSRFAAGLGIVPDADFDAVVADYLAHREV